VEFASTNCHRRCMEALRLDRENGDYSLVEIAIRQALEMA
jgi:hypothetical protein